jgi:hypothetical protein
MPRRRKAKIGKYKHSVRKLTRGEQIFARLREDVSGNSRRMGNNSFSSSSVLPKSTSKKTISLIEEWLGSQRLHYEVVTAPDGVTVYYYTPRH